MAREKTFLEKRRERSEELRQERENKPENYVKRLSASLQKHQGASSGALSAPVTSPKKQTELMRQLDAQRAKIEGRATKERASVEARAAKELASFQQKQAQSKETAQRAEQRREKAKDEGKQQRATDAQLKIQKQGNGQINEGLSRMHTIFKDQSKAIVDAIEKMRKDMKDTSSKSSGSDKPSILGRMLDKKRRQRRRQGKGGILDKAIDIFDPIDYGDDPDIDYDYDRDRGRGRRRRGGRGRGRSRVPTTRGGKIRAGWNATRGFGRSAMTTVAEGATNVAGRVSNNGGLLRTGGQALGKAAEVVGRIPGVSVLGRIAPWAAGADAAYNAAPHVGTLMDSTSDGATKAASAAHLAIQGAGGVIGGVLGGGAGAAYGASLGGHVADGAAWLGRKVADNVDIYKELHEKDGIVSRTSDAVSSAADAVKQSRFAKVLGFAAVTAMTPFSEDARNAFVNEWQNNILPSLAGTFSALGEKITDFTDMVENAGGKLGDGIRNAGAAVWGGIKNAAAQVKEGYQKEGVAGALKSVPGTATKVGQGFAQAGGALKEGVANAGSSVAYDMKKGSASSLDLAMGFSAKTGLKGMSDSETKAYAGNVMKTESGGKLGIVNQYGFAGQYQFGADALADQGVIDKERLAAAKADYKKQGKSWYKDGGHEKFMADNKNWKNEGGREEFLKNKQLQDDTFVKYTNANIEAGYKSGALTANSTPADIAAYAKAAHLKGTGGANDYFLKGKDSTDANGTKVSDYAKGAAQSMTTLAAKVDDAKAKGYTPTDTQLAQKGYKSGETPPEGTKVAMKADDKPKTWAEKEYDRLAAQDEALEKKAKAVGAVNGKTVALKEGKIDEARTAQLNSVTPTASRPQQVASPTTPMASDVKVGHVAVAEARPSQLPMVNPQTPSEPQSTARIAAVENAPPPAQQTAAAPSGQGGGSSEPTLAEVPMYINDLGLVLLNIGHV
jgi:hypothetical protein